MNIRRIVVFVCSLIMLSFNCLSVCAENDTPWASFIEAEDVKINYGNDLSVQQNDGAVNGKVLATPAQTHSLNNAFTLTFTVPEDGEYAIWGRIYYPSQSANSLFYQLDGTREQTIWDFPDEDDAAADCYNKWHYFYLTSRVSVSFNPNSPHGGEYTSTQGEWRHSPNHLKLKAGEHSILFSVRESGWMIDQFVITELKVDEYDPNYCEENNNYMESCKFCNAQYWKHYNKDVFAVKNVTAEEYFETAMEHFGHKSEKVEDKTDATDTTGAEDVNEQDVEQPSDMKLIIVGTAMIIVLGCVLVIVIKKTKKKGISRC